MKKIRIGKDIIINWAITTNGVASSLEDEDLTVEITNGDTTEEIEDFEVQGNVISLGLKGTELNTLGTYTLTLWKNKGSDGQTAVDAVDAFKLVKYTSEEDLDDQYSDGSVANGQFCGCNR